MPNDTFLKILKKGPFPFPLAKTLSGYLIKVLGTLHTAGIAHCDIKPENILIAADYNLKLCDFGFARLSNSNLRPAGGTPGYTAPELYINETMNLFKCDIFALGVVLFIIAMGFPPFQTNDPNARDGWWALIYNKQYDLFWSKCESFRQQQFPIEFKTLIMSMLESDPNKRISLDKLLEHEFLMGGATEEEVLVEIEKRVKEQL
ncbi:unnamed protein product (macronuclear) [Paramecium tetraurelia]|uniref:Protein kinase domain-containing protein n=1 Tax=Paramecium tetraurelia TaxID=5888 RepID=A0CT87_PARTE|nr:uncharacterized protein GSPATT00010238001 [Paramecium tetraurelia]CAK74004.1 unnamed protein product [Paramecium tetraurelia]|eukprot:XP_001441401.1 hypothetical protein (macronuclear) [Paramecium tetraurelia strain d4-2]